MSKQAEDTKPLLVHGEQAEKAAKIEGLSLACSLVLPLYENQGERAKAIDGQKAIVLYQVKGIWRSNYMATKEQMKAEFAYFGEAWNLFKKFYEIQDGDSYWDSLVTEAGLIIKKYGSEPLCKAVVLAIVDELDRKFREGGKKYEAV